jgi:hypothetical protein
MPAKGIMRTSHSRLFLIVFILCSCSFQAFGADSLSVTAIVAKAKEARDLNKSSIRSFKLKLYSKTFFEGYSKKLNDFKPLAIVLVHSDVYWRQPDQFKEIETARRKLDDIPLGGQFEIYGFGIIDDFGRDQIPMGSASVIGPLSRHSDEYYTYALEGTVSFNGVLVYQIRITPKSIHAPLVEGTIFIANDSYQLVGVDIGFNDAVKFFPKPKEFRLKQKFALYDNRYWLPDEIEWTFNIEMKFLGRTAKGHLHIQSQVYDSQINIALDPSVFDGKQVEQAADALYKDSTFWATHQPIAMTEKEQTGFQKLAELPKNKKILNPDMGDFEKRQKKEDIHLGFNFLPDPRYNRVEGAFLGAGIAFEDLSVKNYIRDVTIRTKYGYGFSDKKQKYSGELSKAYFDRKLAFGARYYRDIQHKEMVPESYVLGNSLSALGYRDDVLNYFYTRGYEVFSAWKPQYNWKFEFTYTDRHDVNAARHTRFGLVKRFYKFDPVTDINEGQLKKLSAHVSYKTSEATGISSREPYWILNGIVDHTNRTWLKSDFDFTRYYTTARFHYPTTRRGSFDGKITLGYGTNALPRQYLFDLLGGSSPYVLKTVDISEFTGNHFEGNYLAAMTLEHNFGGELLERTGLPILKDGMIDLIPTCSVGYAHASAKTRMNLPASASIQYLKKPIVEAGFGIGDVFRFVRMDCTWRLNQRHTGTRNFGFTFTVLIQNY